MNMDILGISQLKWTGMDEFNSDDHYIYYSGQESLRRIGVAIIVNKSVLNAVLACNHKNNRMNSVHFQGKPFSIRVIQVYTQTTALSWKSWRWTVPWRPTTPSRTNSQKGCPFHYRGLECKSRKPRNAWRNRQIWPWITEESRSMANRILPRECTGHRNTLFQQHKRRLQMVNTKIRAIIFLYQKWRSCIQ